MADLEKNLQAIHTRIANAASHANRDPREITLVAVSKTFPADAILAAHALGIAHFGENRVEEASEKIPSVTRQLSNHPTAIAQLSNITWHLIGHLQSRKVKDAVALFDFVHSIDSVSLAQKLNARAAEIGKRIPILLEVNISGESTKYGFAPSPRESFNDAVREIIALDHLDTQGLMTVAPIVASPDAARPYFRALRELRDELRARFPTQPWQHLSMGMTDDFESAILEGATILRIGRAIFGERN
ncbi:MAG: YggS family pyridoxal phosphate-dependent enzyme [Chloroflexi bacterium]|nr:YggS family pyridoxal phosphate-dependent enzyme [Chloroflexota bacterium]